MTVAPDVFISESVPITVFPEDVTKRPSKSTVTSPNPERPKVRIPLLVLKLALFTKLFVLEDDIVIELPLLLTVVSVSYTHLTLPTIYSV